MGDANVITVGVAEKANDSLAEMRWMRRSDARSVYGLGKDILDQWVMDGKVEAHKLHPAKNGSVIFSVSDIETAIRNSPMFFPRKV